MRKAAHVVPGAVLELDSDLAYTVEMERVRARVGGAEELSCVAVR